MQETPVPAAQDRTPADPGRCPVCGQDNRCAMEMERITGEKQPPCWCTQIRFDPAALAALPTGARGVSCLCPACARPLPA
ncbi:MAG: cysteine-rich CWC family protein [Burkholderiaceae bacterium]|nr:cysteine-rich CWC family protein [Burkholderiaceae bacterium]